MNISKLTSSILLAATLAACSSVNLPTVARLSALSPLEADPEGLEVAFDLPVGLGIMPDGASLGFAMERSDTGEVRDLDLTLERRMLEGGFVVFRVAPEDLASVRAFQATARAWKDELGGDASGSISAGVSVCLIGDGPVDEAVLSSSIRTSVDGPFFPLIVNASVADILAQAATDLDRDAAASQCP